MEKILIVDDEEFIRRELTRILGDEGYQVVSAGTGGEALELVAAQDADLVLLDLNLPDIHGIDILRRIKAGDPELLVIVVTGYGSVESAVESLKLGAYDFIKKPFKADAIKLIVRLALETNRLRRRVRVLRERELGPGEAVIAESEAFAEVLRQAGDVAMHPETTVLLTGESGVGKEVVARFIHNHSERTQGPFLEINCAAIPPTILESELFGYEAGAFTDARKAKEGLLEAGSGGTVFLDEVGDMELGLQAKLLRFLETRKIRRLGGVREKPVDVRIIAATNRELRETIARKEFREDLYYRLSVFPLRVPPLRERPGDVLPMAQYFLEHFCTRFRKPTPVIAGDARERLTTYGWPGNVRELKNLMERLAITVKTPALAADQLPEEVRGGIPPQGGSWALPPDGLDLEGLERNLARSLIDQALMRTGGNISRAAKLLGLPRGTLRNRMASLGIAIEGVEEPV